jgi:hypothetical protein
VSISPTVWAAALFAGERLPPTAPSVEMASTRIPFIIVKVPTKPAVGVKTMPLFRNVFSAASRSDGVAPVAVTVQVPFAIWIKLTPGVFLTAVRSPIKSFRAMSNGTVSRTDNVSELSMLSALLVAVIIKGIFLAPSLAEMEVAFTDGGSAVAVTLTK